MRLAKTFAIAIASLLFAGVTGSALHAYAQDAEEVDPNASSWNAATDSANEASPEAEAPAARSGGCPTGSVDDTAEGAGDLAFVSRQGGNLKYFFFFWNDENFAEGFVTDGSISSKRISFIGSAGKGCSVTGSGAGDDGNLSGKYKFHGKCAKFFQDGTFSVSIPSIPSICFFDLEKTCQANN